MTASARSAVAAHTFAAEITGAGATFPFPIYSKWADAYKSKSGVGLNYQSIGSGAGIKQIQAKTVTFGATDIPQKADDLAKYGLVQFPMVMGGIVLTVPELFTGVGAVDTRGMVLAIVQAFIFAAYMIITSRIIPAHADGTVTAAWTVLGALLALVPMVVVDGLVVPYTRRLVVEVSLFALVPTVISTACFFRAMRRVAPGVSVTEQCADGCEAEFRRTLKTGAQRTAFAAVLWQLHEVNLRQRGQRLCRAVVHDEHLEARPRLGQHRGDRLVEIAALVVAGDHDAHEGCGHACTIASHCVITLSRSSRHASPCAGVGSASNRRQACW